MIGYELTKEAYSYNEETKKDEKYTHIVGIMDNKESADLWLKKMTPFNTYHVHYFYRVIKEMA